MGNTIKNTTEPTSDMNLSENREYPVWNDSEKKDVLSSSIVPENSSLSPLCSENNLDTPEKSSLSSELPVEYKKSIYEDVPLTKEFLKQNIKKESWLEFQTPLTKHLTKDIHGFDILNFDLMEYGLKYSKYISSVKIEFFSKEFDEETIKSLLRHSRYYLTFDTYNLIFYGNFIQNQNLLLSNNLDNYIVLSNCITKAYNYIDINIIKIKNLLPVLDKIEVKILVSTVEFNEFAEGRINYKSCFEQYYERYDGTSKTWNILNIATNSGCSCIGYSMNMQIKQEEIEETKETEEIEEIEEIEETK
jgi:hypothetical protein